MTKLRITLTLDDEAAQQLAELLDLGADHRYAPTLQRIGKEIAGYVADRVGAARLSRGRARRRRQAAEQLAAVE